MSSMVEHKTVPPEAKGLAQKVVEKRDGGAPPVARAETSKRAFVGRILCVVVPVAVWFAPLSLDPQAKHALAIASFMIIGWITEALAHAVTGLIGCYLFWALGVVNFGAAFGGFANETTWFFFGAVLFGTIATKSGLARRLAYTVLLRVGDSYSRLLLGIVISSFLLTLLVPSGTACVVIMAVVALGLMEAFGLGRGSNVGRGIFITLTYTAGAFDKMVIAGPASILGRGLIEKTAHVQIFWSLWFLAFLPCSLVTIFATWRLAVWLYPPETERLPGGTSFLREELRKMGPWTHLEKKALVLMLLAIGLWVTDLIHHVPPSVVGLGVGLFATLPRLGVLDLEDLKRVNYLPIFFVAAAISMGDVLVQTRALGLLTDVMFSWMGPFITNRFSFVLVPYWTAFVYHILLGNDISMIGTGVPVLVNFANQHGLSPLALGMIWTFAAGGKIFVYQSAVMIVGYSYGYFDTRDMLRVGLCLTVVESILLLLLVPFYWPLLGI